MRLKLPTQMRRGSRLLIVLAVLGGYVAGAAILLEAAGLPEHAHEKGCRVKAEWIWCDGERIFIKGVGWDPTRPKELPWSADRSDALVRADFSAIRRAGFNTVRTWEALTTHELAIAEEVELRVLQGIWIDPEGDYADSSFKKAQLERVRAVARYSSKSPAVLGYLIMNEPPPGHIIQVGIEESRRFMADLANAIRGESPGALVSFASWPGLEFFDVKEHDFVSVNLHPFRPQVLVDTFGYSGLVRIWKQRQGRARPLVVTEFGVSVAPIAKMPNRPGGASEAEQAFILPSLADAIAAEGASGGAAFMWIDGWWKNAEGPGDELTHDPRDGEEWFGLNAMERASDRTGRARPVLAAMQKWNRAVLVEPRNGTPTGRAGVVELFVEEDLASPTLHVTLDGGETKQVAINRRGNWLRGDIEWPPATREAWIQLRSQGRLVGEWQRYLRRRSDDRTLEIRTEEEAGQTYGVVTVRDAEGHVLPGVTVQIALFEASHEADRSHVVVTDPQGVARTALSLPLAPAHALLVAALRESPDRPPVALESLLLDGRPRS